MPEATPDEIIIELKCASCFTPLEIKNSEREHFAFCSDPCRMKGRLFPTLWHKKRSQKTKEWRENNKPRTRAYALKSYHKNKKSTGRPVGRPRKVSPVHNSDKAV